MQVNVKYGKLELDDKTKEELNARIVITLFKIMYNQNKISKKEYDYLVLKACRTFNIKKDLC